MSLLNNILIGTIPALVTGVFTVIATLRVSRKSQLNQNSEIIKDLKESNEREFNIIKEDIGRGGLSSLTEQHNNLQKEIARDFSAIQNRYDKEDAAYSKYSRQQLDTDSAVRFLLEDYRRLIGESAAQSAYIRELEQQLSQYRGERQELDLTRQEQNRGR